MTPSLVVLFAVLSLHPAPAVAHAATSASPALRDDSAQKVWTNDDLKWLEANAPISTFQTPPEQEQPAAAPNTPYVKELDPEWYRKEIERRQNAIYADQSQISALQSARESGAGLSGVIPTEAPMTIDADATIANLRTEIQALTAQINDLEDLARQHSIAPGAIR